MAFLTESDDIPRLLTRGTSQTFRIGFFTDGSKTIPLIPKDPLRYPSYEIKDPNGVTVQSGVLQSDGGVGEYSTNWTVPSDATLSNPNNRYQFTAFIVTNVNEQAEITHEFDVQDVVVTATEDRSQCHISLAGCEFRAMIRCTERIDLDNFGSLKLQVILGNTASKNGYVPIGPQGTTTEVTLSNGQIQEVPNGDSFIYFYDIPEGALKAPNCQYIALWTIRQNIAAAEEKQFTLIRTVDGQILNMTVQLRQLIDKFQKQRGRVQAYEDSDLIEYLDRGLDIINLAHPITSWQMSFAGNSQFTSFILLGAAWYGLNAQYLTEVDLGFAFCLEENSLVHTNRGLVKIKDMKGIKSSYLASEKLLTEDVKNIFNAIKENKENLRCSEILEKFDFDLSAEQLGKLFSRFKLSAVRNRDEQNSSHWVWDLSKFEDILKPYGLIEENEKQTIKYQVNSLGQSKSVTKFIEQNKSEVFSVKTNLGYIIKATKNHGFLTLNEKSLDCVWKPLRDMEIGDLIALDTTPEDDKYWETNFEDVSYLDTPSSRNSKEWTYPNRLTPELARVLGYLTSEGAHSSNSEILFGCYKDTEVGAKMLEQYKKDFEHVFPGRELKIKESSKDYDTGFGGDSTRMRYLLAHGATLRRFLASVGLGYYKSREKEIPWCILQAPLETVGEYLKAHFDGDGCIGKNEIIFTSYSEKWRNQLQAVLLRFGIVSRDNGRDRVTIRGTSLSKYINKIGFLHKNGEILKTNRFYTKREIIPFPVIETIREKTKTVSSNKGWYVTRTGERKRAKISWHRSGGDWYSKHVTKARLRKWWESAEEYFEDTDPDFSNKVNFLLNHNILWMPVKSIETYGEVNVVDISLEGGPKLLDHGFTAGGIIVHNSGQTVTLDYDHAPMLAEAINRFRDYLDNAVTPAKVAFIRATSSVGVFSGKPLGFRALHRFTFPLQSFQSGDIIQTLSSIGIL